MLTQLHDRVRPPRHRRPGRSGIFARQMTDAIALRNRFAMVKGAWDDHLRGRSVPGARRGHRGGEDRAARARAGRRDARARDAGDRRAGGRRDVGPRACPAGYGSRQAAGHAASRGPGPAGPSPALTARGRGRPAPAAAGTSGSAGRCASAAQRERRAARVADQLLVPAVAHSPAWHAARSAVQHQEQRARPGPAGTSPSNRFERRERVDPLRASGAASFIVSGRGVRGGIVAASGTSSSPSRSPGR